MNYLHYTTALTGRDQAALLAITWPQRPILLDADFDRIESVMFSARGWTILEERVAVWDESHYMKIARHQSMRVNYEGCYSGRFTR